ncbi:hypothetical protein F5B21DRAFT_466306 [Xylaria acuta]|nr:hypothetical protein F5B21DRAFT_466306 [Xylaria acuta]
MSSHGHHSHGRTHDRSRSRADAFLDALESGQVREAIGTLKPSSQPHDGHGHRHHHHDTRVYDHYGDRRNRHDDYHPREDGYYLEEVSRPPRRHRSAHSDRYYYDYDDHRRGRSSGHHHSHHQHSSHGHSSSRHRRSASSHGPDLKQAAGAAVAAGVVEAFRSRHDPDRTVRVATAAIGAAATDSVLGGGGRHDHTKEKRHVAESALAGLVENRVINGPRR